MEIWLDTINYTLIEKITALMNITGVTTNPSLLALHNMDTDFDTIVKTLLKTQNGYVAIQVISDNVTDVAEIIRQSKNLVNAYGNRIIIKIPANYAGYEAINILEKSGIKTLATAIFEEKQVLLSALSGATYATPYLGRIGQVCESSINVIHNMLDIININQYKTKLMVAAIKSTHQLIAIAKFGVQAITVPEAVLLEMIDDNKYTTESITQFYRDFNSNEQIVKDFYTKTKN